MKKLILMRHAKSDWSLHLDDHERPLNRRGERAAPALGHWLTEHGHRPDQVMASDSRRTIQTHDLLGLDTSVQPDARLYLSSAEEMLNVLKEAEGKCLLMIAHNPGIAELAAKLVSTVPDHHRFFDYPTGATLVLRFDVSSWGDIELGVGKTLDFTVPRALG